ncbi:uncharacterized protein LOC105781432 [Gossypium raimondii]|uniref:uncharacterized protein LOC105781432 n=1 Tax=Gossypium raimondii TaxID=29730 RepID=UPI00063AF06D|nr:uncharacterized protein LOC105781432 [Gossypium raimondii]
MSARGTRGRGTRGRGRGRRGALPESSSLGSMPNLDTSETSVSPVTETGGIAGVAPNVAEYWIKATERIMDNLNCTPKHKLKGVVSLLRDEAYQWWLTVKEGYQVDRLTFDIYKTAFQEKYVGASYVDARRREVLNLTQGYKSVADYEAKFLRLSRYARRMVATDYERCVQFEDGLRNSLRVLIAPQRERNFATLVDKAKIAEEVKRIERLNREKGRNKRDSEPLSFAQKLKKKARVDELVRVGAPITAIGPKTCVDCGRHHQNECWKRIEACLRCGSLEHRIRDCPRRLG